MATNGYAPARAALAALIKETPAAAPIVAQLQAGLVADAYQRAVAQLLEVALPLDMSLGDVRNTNASRRIFIELAIQLGLPEADPEASAEPEPELAPAAGVESAPEAPAPAGALTPSDDLVVSDDLLVG